MGTPTPTERTSWVPSKQTEPKLLVGTLVRGMRFGYHLDSRSLPRADPEAMAILATHVFTDGGTR